MTELRDTKLSETFSGLACWDIQELHHVLRLELDTTEFGMQIRSILACKTVCNASSSSLELQQLSLVSLVKHLRKHRPTV